MLTPLPPGSTRRIGPYRLLARIGAGGMGEVFLARREQGRLVALKAVRQELDLDMDDAFRVRFRREIAAARAVTGPFTAALLDGDADARLPWLATEYVPGPSLADTVARCGPLPVDAVRALGAKLARALAAVHAARVLHRDLKPGNVLLTPDGPRLIDFGIAQAFEATALTMTGMLVGTPGFMAPEQIEGSHAVVPASDVFSLGAVLCHAAAGHGPFDDPEFASVVFRIARGDADLSGVPDELRGLVAECLDTDPDRRPTPVELAERLADGTAPAPFPWPSEALSLFAEYRSAAAGFEQSEFEHPGADVPPPPQAPPALGSFGPAPVLGKRRLPWVVASAAAAVVVTVAAVLLPDVLADDPAAAPSASPRPDAAAPAGRVVTAYGNQGHSGEFGTSAVREAALPEGWKPWSRKKPKGVDSTGKGCVMARSTLVCRDGRGAATALDAATGKDRWKAPGLPGNPTGVQENPPETDGERVFVPSELGVIGLDLATGDEVWRHTVPEHSGVISVTYAQGVVYTAEFNSRSAPAPYTTVVRARRASTGRQLWETSVDGRLRGTLLAQGDRLYAALEAGGAIALSARTGDEKAEVSKPACDDLIGYDGAVLCWSVERKGVSVLDGGTLASRRTIGAAKQPDVAPVVGEKGVLVIAGTDEKAELPDRLSAYDWKSGKELWDLPARGTPSALGLSGDRLLSVGSYEIRTVSLDGDAENVTQRTIPTTDVKAIDGLADTLTTPLYLGGAVFAESVEGRLVSGRAL
ncbi:protein kinase domain-containing protein [Streptomyces sp. NPDC055243]|uniref:protein kinase domain-containing protein n=1 Tax=Streptomyces sp. NPDC055243 TaxID=3365720 RepID=UPI0037D8237F